MFLSHKKNRKENAIGSCDNTWLHCLDSLLGEERENNKKGQEKKKKRCGNKSCWMTERGKDTMFGKAIV